jgi:RimJ/RimL family protein N-acetyltransferase
LRSNSITVRTERLWLRPCESLDLDRVHELWTSPEIREFLFDGRRIPREGAQSIIDASDRCFTERGYGIWLFFAADEKEQLQLIAGFVGLLHDSPKSPRLVFGTRPVLRGRGYAVEASLAVLRHAFGVLGLPRVFADVDEPNRASISVLGKLGMKPTGRESVAGRQLLYYEIASAL